MTLAEDLLHLRMQMELGSEEIFFEEPLVISKVVSTVITPPPELQPQIAKERPSSITPSRVALTELSSSKPQILVVPDEAPKSQEDLQPILQASNLDLLRDAILHHPFYRLAPGKPGRIAWATGPLAPPLMLIGDWPSEEELQLGSFYAGAQGEMLRKMLENLNHSRNLCYATWLCKKPLLKSPLPRQANGLRAMLEKEIQLVRPAMVLLLGEHTLRIMLKRSENLEQDFGQAFQLFGVPTVAIHSPREMSVDPKLKAITWNEQIPRSGLFQKKG